MRQTSTSMNLQWEETGVREIEEEELRVGRVLTCDDKQRDTDIYYRLK